MWLVVEGPSRHWPCVAVPGGRQWWPARGSVPRWRAWAGTDAVGPSPVRVAEVPAVRDLLPSRRAMRGGRRRARSARPVAKCVWARCRGRSPPLTHRGAPVRPACRRGAAVGVAAAMIPVHSDPPASRRRAAVSQFPAEKDYSGARDHSDSAAPRRGDPRVVRRFTSSCTCTVTSLRLRCVTSGGILSRVQKVRRAPTLPREARAASDSAARRAARLLPRPSRSASRFPADCAASETPGVDPAASPSPRRLPRGIDFAARHAARRREDQARAVS